MRYPILPSSKSCPALSKGHFAIRAVATCVTLLALSLPAQPTAPGGPIVNLKEPVAVTVTNPVEIQGSIEVVNDALKTPFQRGVNISMGEGAAEIEDTVIALPANKRLVIETITIQSNAPVGQTGWATLGLGSARAHLATQVVGTNAFTTRSIGSHSLTFRLNTNQVSQLHLQVLRSASTGSANIQVSLFGYTEDI
jgi:hypothetical protein